MSVLLVKGEGNPHADIVFIGEAPGEEEDETGKPFVGSSGKLLTKAINHLGLERYEVYITNVVKVRPPNNRKPTEDEIESWKSYLFNELNEIEPKIIVPLGSTATSVFLGKIFNSIGKHVGNRYFWGYRNCNCGVIPMYHPSYILRGKLDKEAYYNQFLKILEYVKS